MALAELDLALLAAEERLAEARHRAGLRIADAARREERSARTLARREQLEQELEESRSGGGRCRGSHLPSVRGSASTAAEAAAAARAAHETALAAIVEAQPWPTPPAVAHRSWREGGRHARRARRAPGTGGGARPPGSILSAAGWRALLDGIDAPEEAWPAVEAIVGGELEQALLWQDGELAGRLVDARGSARLLADGSPGAVGPSDAARADALATIGSDRTLADWIGGDRDLPVLFRWTALLPDVERLLGAWRSLPAGWLAVTPAGDMADSRGLLVLRGRAESNGSAAAQRHGRRRELAQALEAIDQEQAAAAAEAARAMAAVTEAGRRLEDARRSREASERDERAVAADLEAAELTAERAGAAESRIVEELAAIQVADPGDDADAEVAPDAALTTLEDELAALRDRRGAATQERDRARKAWTTAQASAREIEDRQLGAERSRSVEAARQIQAEATATSQRVARSA